MMIMKHIHNGLLLVSSYIYKVDTNSIYLPLKLAAAICSGMIRGVFVVVGKEVWCM